MKTKHTHSDINLNLVALLDVAKAIQRNEILVLDTEVTLERLRRKQAKLKAEYRKLSLTK